jgi:hypothetical protein
MKLRTHFLSLALAGSMLCTVSAPALAAGTDAVTTPEPSAISVQLDGKNVAFTDAEPEVVSQRTFLPFRAIFEAMGATVSYEADSQTVVATRGDKTVRMVIGAKEATVTEDGTTNNISMDVAAYAKDNHTYVPVRFAAQAFGCNVGWDQDTQTVIVLDTENLVENAFPDDQFTILQKYLDYTQQFSEGNWALDGSFQGNVSMASMDMPLSGTITGVTSDSSLMQMAMQMELDLSKIIDTATADTTTEDTTEEDLATLEALKKLNIGIDLRSDLDSGKLYMNVTGEALELAGIDPSTWYCIDMNSMMSDYGMGGSYAQLLKLCRSMNLPELVAYVVNAIPLDDSSTTYTQVADAVNLVADMLKDSSFKQDGNDYTTNFTYDEDGTSLDAALTLNTKNDKVVGYSITCTMDAPQAQADGTTKTARVLDVTAGMDASNQATMTMKFGAADIMAIDFTMKAQYATTTKTPDTQVPAGAKVVDYADMLSGNAE